MCFFVYREPRRPALGRSRNFFYLSLFFSSTRPPFVLSAIRPRFPRSRARVILILQVRRGKEFRLDVAVAILPPRASCLLKMKCYMLIN